MRTARRSAGFSMVELLIAVTLGLVLLLGVTQVYQGYKQSYNQQEGMAELQETARFATQFLVRTVRQAGYRHSPTGTATDVFHTNNAVSTLAVEGTEGAAGAPDTLVIRFQGSSDGLVVDCQGQAVSSAVPTRIAVNTFSIDTVSNELECLRQIDDDPDANDGYEIGAAGTPQPLLSGVTDMQITYGIDSTPGDGVMRVNQYLDADGIGGAGEPGWDAVVSVQIVLTVQSLDQFLQPDGSRQPLQRTVKTVVNLRNRLS